MGIKVLSPGLKTSVQDFGRLGQLKIGMAPSGAMDIPALALANLLVGNSMGEAGLEFCLQGPSLEFESDTCVAVTGGFSLSLNNAEAPTYTTLNVAAGDILTIGTAKNGNYGYLAVYGGFDIDPVFESKSTNVKCGIGGMGGAPLKAGVTLPLSTSAHRAVRRIIPPSTQGEIQLIRVVMGPQEDMFTQNGIKEFLQSVYTVTSQCDRMGIRLDGPRIDSISGTDIISDATVFGAIQVPGDGRPIVLMADRQTTGGYAKIGVIASVDIPRIAQARPGSKLKFVSIGIDEAQKIYTDYWAAMEVFSQTFLKE